MEVHLIKKLRRETPGCNYVNHLNNAGAALMPSMVVWAIKKFLDLESKIGGYEAAEMKAEELAEFYELAATMINAKAHQIAFTANATDAYSRALSSIPFKAGDIILSTRHDYISNQIAFLSFKNRLGVQIRYMPCDSDGLPDLDQAHRAIKEIRPRLVAVTHIPTNCGSVQPVEKIGAICRDLDVLYLVDACQSIGQRRIDVGTMHCDFLSVTARKFLRGPRGAGFLFVSDKVLKNEYHPLLVDMRGARWVSPESYELFAGARRFEDWEFPYALMQGTKEAIRYAVALGINRIEDRVTHLAAVARKSLDELDGVCVLDRGNELSGIVTVAVDSWEPKDLKNMLQAQKINTSVSDRDSAIFDFDLKGTAGALRISPHYYNTEEEIAKLAQAMASRNGRIIGT